MIFGLPRCRTAWFSTLLSLGQRTCHHELETKCEDLREFLARVSGAGNASTLMWKFLPTLREHFPGMRYVWLERNFQDCARSVANLGFGHYNEQALRELSLEAEVLGAKEQLVVNVDELTYDIAKAVWSHLIVGDVFPESKILNLLRMNVQLTDTEFQRVVRHPVPWIMEALT